MGQVATLAIKLSFLLISILHFTSLNDQRAIHKYTIFLEDKKARKRLYKQ